MQAVLDPYFMAVLVIGFQFHDVVRAGWRRLAVHRFLQFFHECFHDFPVGVCRKKLPHFDLADFIQSISVYFLHGRTDVDKVEVQIHNPDMFRDVVRQQPVERFTFSQCLFRLLTFGDIMNNAFETCWFPRSILDQGYGGFNIFFISVFPDELPIERFGRFSRFIDPVEGLKKFFCIFFVGNLTVIHSPHFIRSISQNPAHRLVEECKVAGKIHFIVSLFNGFQKGSVLFFVFT